MCAGLIYVEIWGGVNHSVTGFIIKTRQGGLKLKENKIFPLIKKSSTGKKKKKKLIIMTVIDIY